MRNDVSCSVTHVNDCTVDAADHRSNLSPDVKIGKTGIHITIDHGQLRYFERDRLHQMLIRLPKLSLSMIITSEPNSSFRVQPQIAKTACSGKTLLVRC